MWYLVFVSFLALRLLLQLTGFNIIKSCNKTTAYYPLTTLIGQKGTGFSSRLFHFEKYSENMERIVGK